MSYQLTGPLLMSAAKLATTAPTVILEATSRTTIASIICTETAGATPALSLELFDGTTGYSIRKALPLSARQTFVFDQELVLKSGWQLRATAGAANQIDVIVNYCPPVPAGTWSSQGSVQ